MFERNERMHPMDIEPMNDDLLVQGQRARVGRWVSWGSMMGVAASLVACPASDDNPQTPGSEETSLTSGQAEASSDSSNPEATGTATMETSEGTTSGIPDTEDTAGETGETVLEPLPRSDVSNLPFLPGDANVPVPAGAAGGLEVLDWAGFTAAVTYTFDDANSSQIANYEALQNLGVPMSFYLITGKSEASNPIWAQAILDGHEIANHSQSHPMVATEAELDNATTFLVDTLGVEVWTMAAPYGDPSYAELARTRFLINRGVANGLMLPNDMVDPFSIYTFTPPMAAPAATFNTQVDGARTAGGWRTMLIHGFTGGTDGAYLPVDLSDFVESVAYARSLGDLWIDSTVNVGAYWLGQRAFTQGTMTPSGADQVWTWTLPDHFPPGHYLRVTVTGGTLTQDGTTPLVWDPHGFYEVPLDAGTLTLSP